MKEYISFGKNVDIAIEDGLKYLNLDKEDVDIKILETGGLFKKAKVCLLYDDKPNQVELEETQKENEEKVDTINEEEKVDLNSEEDKKEDILQEDKLVNAVVEEVEPIKAKDANELIEREKAFLIGLANRMNIKIEVECNQIDNNLNFNITGNNVGKLIGYRGETLIAIQSLLSTLKQSGEGKYRIYLDVSGYKAQREQTLIDLANKMADKAEEIERNVHLDPMNAYERRIIHSTLQNRILVETESMGEGEKRHVVIKFKR